MSPGTKHKQLLAAKQLPVWNPYAGFVLSTRTVIAKDLSYPRAGVRKMPDGKWLLQIWYTPGVVRLDEKPLTHSSPLGAFFAGQREVHAARARRHPAGQVWLAGYDQDTVAS